MSLRVEDGPLGTGWYLVVDRNDAAVAAFTTLEAAVQYCDEKNAEPLSSLQARGREDEKR